MSTNEERLKKSIGQIEKYIAAAESVGHTATQYREEDGTLRILVFSDLGLVLDALNYTTHELEETTRELNAYKRAKAENDDRFMNERDEARVTVAKVREYLKEDKGAYAPDILAILDETT